MLKVFYRRFYILLFLIWLMGTAGLFVLSVWGNLEMFVFDFRQVVEIEERENEAVVASEDVAMQTMDTAVKKARVAKDFIRRSVSQELREVEEVTEEVLGIKHKPELDEPSMVVVEERAEKMLKEARQHKGAGKLTSISFVETDDALVADLKTSKSVGKITRFWLANPTRLVVDLRGNWRNATSRLHTFEKGFMYQVVIGMHSDRLRVVFRFDDANTPKGKLPDFQYTKTGVKIIVDRPVK